MKIKKVEIQAFRAYNLKENGTFDLTSDGESPSNFVAIYGPNGFGKSSFYDAIEWGLTDNITRYTFEETRLNNLRASKGTQQADQPQYFLRNKEADEITKTFVKIDTTLNSAPFFRQLKNARKGSTDFKFSKPNLNSEAKSFQNLILSQDAIERFMREESPHSRYINFMKQFGGEAEEYRETLAALLMENHRELEQLNDDKKSLDNEINKPFDATVFDAFNNIAKELNQSGERVPLLNQDIDESIEREVLFYIVNRLRELKTLNDLNSKKFDFLNLQVLKLENIEHSTLEISGLKTRLSSLKDAIKNSKNLEALKQESVSKQSALKEIKEYQFEINAVEKAIPKFIEINHELDRIEKTIIELSKSKTSLSASLVKFEVSTKNLVEQLSDLNREISEKNNLLVNSSRFYLDINSLKILQKASEDQLQSNQRLRELEISLREDAFLELNRISELDFDIKNFISTDLSLLNLDPSELSEIQSISQQINSINRQIENVQQANELFKFKVSTLENIKLLGLEYLKNSPSEACPLCKSTHESSEHLKQVIELNDFRPEIAALNQSLHELNELKDQINSKLSDRLEKIKSKRLDRITFLQARLSESAANIEKINHDDHVTSSELSSINLQIEALNNQLLNLDSDKLNARIKLEMEGLEAKKVSLQNEITEATAKIDSTKKGLMDNESETSKHLTTKGELTKCEEYITVQNYMLRTGAFPESLIETFTKELHSNKELYELLEIEVKNLADLIEKSQSVLYSQNFGLDHLQLLDVEDYTEKQLLERQNEVATFIESTSRNLISPTTFAIDNASSVINHELLAIRLDLENSKDKFNKFESLKDHLEIMRPYVYRIKQRGELSNLENAIVNHTLAEAELRLEMTQTIKIINNQIDAFFYADLINLIYSKIDPHPSFKKIDFRLDPSNMEKPGLNILLTNEAGDQISPSLYFSAAQINILSLSVFLANALHAKDKNGQDLKVIMMDDPIQAMDSINILSTIDLIRNLMTKFDRQFIVSTHDENFFELLKKKIPTEVFQSKFLKLESYGTVKQVS